MQTLILAYGILVAAMSLVTLITYGIDKRRARADKRRVPEKTLHWLALLGGWPGAVAGQRLFRHKTQKLRFRVCFWLVVTLHVIVVGSFVYIAAG